MKTNSKRAIVWLATGIIGVNLVILLLVFLPARKASPPSRVPTRMQNALHQVAANLDQTTNAPAAPTNTVSSNAPSVALVATNPVVPPPVATNQVKAEAGGSVRKHWEEPATSPAREEFEKGLKYAQGNGVPKDFKEAARWIRQAAEAGRVEAQFNLGLLLVAGEGIQQDFAEALKWFTKAAEAGHPDAQFNTAIMHVTGRGTEVNYEKGAGWARKAAEQGHPDAAYNLALLYTSGMGVDQDAAEAARWFRVAAEQGVTPAQSNLGVFYIHGKGVPQDYKEAHHWFLQAAQKGNPTAQFNLGVMYAKGQGMETNMVESYFWSSLAAMRGDQEASANRDKVGMELTPKQVADTVKRITAFIATNQPNAFGSAAEENR